MDQQPNQPMHRADEAETIRVMADRLRRLRKANGLSLRQLAVATGTSASFLSQLERGLSGASTSTLIRIANCFGTSISELFAGADDGRDPVLRRQMRPSLPVTKGQRKMLLSRRPLTHFETYIAEFDVGGSSGDDAYTHGDSHEMILVLRGQVRLELGGISHELNDGDSVEYATSVPHRVVNIGDGAAEVLFMISPPTSTGTYLDGFRDKGGLLPKSAATPPLDQKTNWEKTE
ncbi:cupin [Cypionkella aquatica]|uniref:Cupin n=1 Tax=Cypionkella aquatica TaxID=1756042 RepID=A0AA37TVG0_9RHOB|nr:XRE family transcriptional regulator [Cypionkella aquatica]GLS86498.1 cupin [Cypionkella aquatica]